MPNYLIIRNNKVENVILADTQEIAELVAPEGTEVRESTGAEPWIDWTRSGDTWTAPVVEDAPTE
jgi:hypothetical protein